MSSTKCRHCGLVNFASVKECKRCNQSLNKFSSIASQRDYQKKTANRFRIQQNTNCIMCGSNKNVSVQTIEKDFVPTAAAFANLFGLGILGRAATIRHKVNVHFCGGCWTRYEYSDLVQILGFVVGGAMVFLGISTIIHLDSVSVLSIPSVLIILGLFSFIGITLAILGIIYSWSSSPKVKLVDRDKVIFESKLGKELVFEK